MYEDELPEEEAAAGDEAAAAGDTGDEIPDIPATIKFTEHLYYLAPLIRFLTILHTVVSLSILIAYYCLKVNFVMVSL